MKKYFISMKDLINGNHYWCMYNGGSTLYLMTYLGSGIFDKSGVSVDNQGIRVMFDGCINISKSRIPKKNLVIDRYYWCKYRSEELNLMRFQGDGLFYSRAHDVFWPEKDINVIFENCDL